MLGSIEYGCSAGGAKLVLVLGHTRCGAITESVNCLAMNGSKAGEACKHLQFIVEDVSPAVDEQVRRKIAEASPFERERQIDEVARRHVELVIEAIREQSPILRELENQGQIRIIGGMYDVRSGTVDMSIGRDGQAGGVASRTSA